ncbi:hypothetical protein TI05_04000 [Achromatium sp. WMS3]|nr:hypothetical protein TI05_04000 [Achromatium sp. WMS3]
MAVLQLNQIFTGLLSGLIPGKLQSRGLLEILALFPIQHNARSQFVPPLQNLKLVAVPDYGKMTFRNTTSKGLLILPMHIGFFQDGAQNHATSRAMVLDAQEDLTATDCFCIQETQGGLLDEANQRFIVLPLGLRPRAFVERDEEDFSRLWIHIENYTRKFGVSKSGHLERFIRPYFPKLQTFRHAFETEPGQIGAVYFIAGQLVGIEVAPNPEYWQDLWPILLIYCYGPEVFLAENLQSKSARTAMDLYYIEDLEDLRHELRASRRTDLKARIKLVAELSAFEWKHEVDRIQHKLRIVNLEHQEWAGQMVQKDSEILYLSLFRNK